LNAAEQIARIEAALNAGETGRAVELSEAFLATGRVHPLPLWVTGSVLEQAGRFELATARLGEAARLAPNDPVIRLTLARCHLLARRPDEALRVLDEALVIAPRFAPALDMKARALQSMGELDGARAHFERAAEADPTDVAGLTGLAGLAIVSGDWEGARTAAERVLARRPGRGEAIWILARAALGQGDFAAAEPHLSTLLARPDLAPLARGEALLALGEARRGQGRHAEAFQAWAAGKAIQHELYAERAAGRPSETAKARDLAAWVSARAPETWSPPAPPAPVEGEAAIHVFLAGFPRSGTTLLEQVLAGHPDVVTLEERPTLAEPIDAFMMSAEGLDRLARLSDVEAQDWRSRYWRGIAAEGLKVRGKLFLDKAPGETSNLLLMARLFPRAKILFAVRDPRDVVLSCLRHDFQMNAMTYGFTTLEGAAECYDAVMSAARLYRERLQLDLLEVRHEALVADLEARGREICAFLGLDWSPAMADVAATARTRRILTPSAPQVRAGVNASGVGGWRAYRADLQPVLARLAPWVKAFGYPPDDIAPDIPPLGG
jgi:tetratricopeptide (TPR) repeat protein